MTLLMLMLCYGGIRVVEQPSFSMRVMQKTLLPWFESTTKVKIRIKANQNASIKGGQRTRGVMVRRRRCRSRRNFDTARATYLSALSDRNEVSFCITGSAAHHDFFEARTKPLVRASLLPTFEEIPKLFKKVFVKAFANH